MFNRSWKRLLREMFRRTQEIIKNERYDDFPEVQQFVIRCGRRGITEEMILAVERVNEVRPSERVHLARSRRRWIG
jgi:hypothetical protein